MNQHSDRIAFWIAALVLGLSSLVVAHLWNGPTAAASQTLFIPPDRVGIKGMVGHWWYADRYGPRLLDEYANLGVTNVRLAVDWLHIEAVQGERRYHQFDPIINGLRDRGIDVLPVIATMPPWATVNGGECFVRHLVCRLDRRQVLEFQKTMGELVRRYPHITTWEFWNEPEMWEGMRDPAEYEFWYRAFYEAAKEANPAARVGVSTLTGWDFFDRLSSDLPYDAVAVHSYTDHTKNPIDDEKVERLRNGLVGRGRFVPIWLTEYGWAQWLDNKGRSEAIDWSMRWLLERPYIELAHYHMLHDTEEYWECCFGMIGGPPDFSPKQPAYDRFRSYTVIGR